MESNDVNSHDEYSAIEEKKRLSGDAVFFFFKQKTAYEIKECDWSSDVCSSDLVSEAEVDPEVIAKEREIYAAQAAESGKPADIIDKMVDGRVKKYLKECTLLGQPFIKDPDQTVEQLLKKAGANVSSFVRFEVGEGIEKKTENFADEVMAQIKA